MTTLGAVPISRLLPRVTAPRPYAVPVAGGSTDDEFETFMRANYAACVRQAYQYLHDNHAADDVAQQVMVKLWKKPPHTWTTAYLRTAVGTTCLDHMKKEKRRRTHEEARTLLDSRRPHEPVGTLDAALHELEPRLRFVLISRYEIGLSVAEIASQMSYSTRQVERFLDKAKTQLAARMALVEGGVA